MAPRSCLVLTMVFFPPRDLIFDFLVEAGKSGFANTSNSVGSGSND